MTTPHPHAALIKLWADDPTLKFEYRNHPDPWAQCVISPKWNAQFEYRLAPESDPHFEVKQAFANGAKIQYKNAHTNWADCVTQPEWNRTSEYRVHPHWELMQQYEANPTLPLEVRGPDGVGMKWRDVHGEPSWNTRCEYRIKPNPVVRWVPVFTMPAGSIVLGVGRTDRQYASSSDWNGKKAGETLASVLRLEFDPDTKELISCTQEAP